MKNSWALFFLGSKHDVILSLSKSERSAEDQALLMFCAITRGQWFNDGNKRTALMATNHVLVNAGIGVFAISPSLKHDFTNRLLRYYESDDPAPLCAWLRDYAIGRLPGGLTSAESRRLETERIKSGRPSIGLPIPNPISACGPLLQSHAERPAAESEWPKEAPSMDPDQPISACGPLLQSHAERPAAESEWPKEAPSMDPDQPISEPTHRPRYRTGKEKDQDHPDHGPYGP